MASQVKAIRPVAAYMGENVLLDQGCVDRAREMARDLRKQGRAQSMINNHLQVVKRVLNLAYREWGWIEQPLGDKLKKRSPKNERHVYLTTEELGELLKAIPDSDAVVVASCCDQIRQNRARPGWYRYRKMRGRGSSSCPSRPPTRGCAGYGNRQELRLDEKICGSTICVTAMRACWPKLARA